MSKILVIDDDEMIRYVITLMLESDGFEVNEAGNGKEAMDYIKKQSFDLVITDIEMPEMNGFEIINKLHKDFPNVKIVVISGAGFSYDRGNTFNKAKKLGANCCLEKPFNFEELIEAVEALIA